MKILVTGKGGKAGSWQIRGKELGFAIGARVLPFAELDDCLQCDVAIVVKRTPATVLEAIRAAGKPWVFDCVDCYPQPACSDWSRNEAIQWMRAKLQELRPNGVIWPTQRMRSDCDTGLPGMVLKHHHRPWIEQNPIRENVATVGYEGDARYLEEWRPILQKECASRGWAFVENPEKLADLDIVVAQRGRQWNGYALRHWKSGIKLANAHASGTPFVGPMECGYTETSTGGEYWADEAHMLRLAFEWLGSQSTREQVSERFLKAAYPVEKAAADLKEFLRAI